MRQKGRQDALTTLGEEGVACLSKRTLAAFYRDFLKKKDRGELGYNLRLDILLFFNLRRLRVWKLVLLEVVFRVHADLAVKGSHIDSHRVFDAPAVADIVADVKPVREGEVDCLGNIESKVETGVVSCCSGHHELVLVVQALDHLYLVFKEHRRVDDGCLVADELAASAVVLRVVLLHEFFENFVVTEVDGVPELGVAVVQVVYAVKVEVLFMPPEHCLPAPHVDVGIRDSWDFLTFSKAVATTKKNHR